MTEILGKNWKENIPDNFDRNFGTKLEGKYPGQFWPKKAWEKIGRKISRAVLVKKGMGKNRKENIPGNFDRNFRNMFEIVRGTFWPKLVKNRGFRPNGHHEEFRSVKNIQIQSVRCQKALTRTPFVTEKNQLNPCNARINYSSYPGNEDQCNNFLNYGIEP